MKTTAKIPLMSIMLWRGIAAPARDREPNARTESQANLGKAETLKTSLQTFGLSLAFGLTALWSSSVRAQATLAPAAESSVLVAAVQWLQGVMLGTVATVLAVIAIAFIGFGMLTGRIDVRRAFLAVVGCFIVFNAPSIAAGLLEASKGETADATAGSAASPAPLPSFSASPAPSDPYAGASVPVR